MPTETRTDQARQAIRRQIDIELTALKTYVASLPEYRQRQLENPRYRHPDLSPAIRGWVRWLPRNWWSAMTRAEANSVHAAVRQMAADGEIEVQQSGQRIIYVKLAARRDEANSNPSRTESVQ